jgi:hypothetical protein
MIYCVSQVRELASEATSVLLATSPLLDGLGGAISKIAMKPRSSLVVLQISVVVLPPTLSTQRTLNVFGTSQCNLCREAVSPRVRRSI